MEGKIRIATDKSEQNVLDHIRDYGWSILHIFDPEYKSPNFSYSIGLYEGFQSPEVIIFSMSQNDALNIITLLASMLKKQCLLKLIKYTKSLQKNPLPAHL
jgi:hypothetical protein